MPRGIRKPKVFSVVNFATREIMTVSEPEATAWLANHAHEYEDHDLKIIEGHEVTWTKQVVIESITPTQQPTEKKPRKKRETKNGAPTIAGVLDGKNGKGEEKTA